MAEQPPKADEIMRRLRAGRITFQCCFCHKGIEGEVCALRITRHWNEPESEQKTQQFFCHQVCFESTSGELVEVGDKEKLHG
jgi:hypothetical protein